MRIRAAAAALLSAVALGALVLPSADAAPQASTDVAQPRATQQTFRNAHTNWCLADRGVKNSAGNFIVTMVPPTGNDCNHADTTQVWKVSGLDGEWLQLRNVRTGRCLDDSPNGLTIGSTCWPAKTAKAVYQMWDSSGFGNGMGIRLQNYWSRACLDDSADRGIRTNVQCANYKSKPESQTYQAWR
jgi:hypothetical protein